jgi:hypothetical protein
LARLLEASYADGYNEPRGGYRSAKDSGHVTGKNRKHTFEYPCTSSAEKLLPNPRRVSIEMHSDVNNEDNRV